MVIISLSCILYLAASAFVVTYIYINKAKLKIIMSCQKPIVRVPQIVFYFFQNLQPSNSENNANIYWIISQHFFFQLLCYFSFDFICAFVALNFDWNGEISELSKHRHRHDSVKQRRLLRKLFALPEQPLFTPRVHVLNSSEKGFSWIK